MAQSLAQSDHGLRIEDCAAALGVSRATAYRALKPVAPSSPAAPVPVPRAPKNVPRALSPTERKALLDLMNSERFMDQPPREIFASLLSEGAYHASVSTMYRLLRQLGQCRERRSQRAPARYQAPAVRAEKPNEVWVWDITRLPGPRPGVWFYVYVILDLFSRYVVGWLVAEHENAAHAEHLFAATLLRHGIAPGSLCVHSDRGAPMTASLLQDTFIDHGIAPSFSRPQVSNDNPHAEASFRTMKGQPDFPKRFPSQVEARRWLEDYVDWYNHAHHHVALALFTPAEVFQGTFAAVLEKRQAAMDAMWHCHPERFPHGRPRVAAPPSFVAIDPDGVHAHGEDWHDTSPLNPLSACGRRARKPSPNAQCLLKF